MTPRTLRRRLNTVLLQWLLLFVAVAATVVILAFPGMRRTLLDDRLVLARTITKSLDATLSASVQDLGRLASDLPDAAVDRASRLRTFRFQSLFADAIYIVDSEDHVVASDPPAVTPISLDGLTDHESVTPLVRTRDANPRPVLAIVEPFSHYWADYRLVSEMNPIGSRISAFLTDVEGAPDMHVVVVDENGVVVASNDPRQLLKTMTDAGLYRERIRAHRPLVLDEVRCDFERAGEEPAAALMVMVPLQFAPWGVVIEQHKTAALAGVYTLWRWLALAGGLFATITVLLVRTLSRSVVAPIGALSRQAETMRRGDFSHPITVTGDVEVAMLAKTLDEARSRLQSTLGELQSLNGNLETQVAQRTKALEEQDEHRKVLIRRLLNATEEERRRLARELHDEISQMLTVIQLSLDRADEDPAEMGRAKALLGKTQQEIHRIIYDLRPSLLDDLGLAAAMESYAQQYLGRQGLEVSLEIDQHLKTRPATDTVIFRIYQELVTNILRHAKAERVSVELYERDHTRVLAVEDDGVGFDPAARSEGAGVMGMRERAALVNGVIRFDSEPGEGTHVVVEIPVQ